MRILKYPKINALLISIISTVYALLFIATSGHIEFTRQFSHPATLNSGFWNSWSSFVRGGSMKYIGYIIIALTVGIIILTILKKRTYDEYQINILAKGFIAAGIITVLMLPFILVLVLSDKNYAIETLFLFMAVQWIAVLVVDLIYTTKYFKE